MINYHMKITGNAITVDRKKLDLYAAIDWSKKHCPHYITNHYHGGYDGNDLIDFCFLDCEKGQQEMNWFIMRWS